MVTVTNENWENCSEGKSLSSTFGKRRRACFVFRHEEKVWREKGRNDAPPRWKNECKWEKRMVSNEPSSIRLPLRSVDGWCHRPLVGTRISNPVSVITAPETSPWEREREERRKRKREGGGKKRRKSGRESKGSVTGGDYSSRLSLFPSFVEGRTFVKGRFVGRVGDIGASRDGYRGLELSERGERGKFRRFYQSRLNKSLRQEIKGEQFRSWIEMDIHGSDSRRRRWWRVFPEQRGFGGSFSRDLWGEGSAILSVTINLSSTLRSLSPLGGI